MEPSAPQHLSVLGSSPGIMDNLISGSSSSAAALSPSYHPHPHPHFPSLHPLASTEPRNDLIIPDPNAVSLPPVPATQPPVPATQPPTPVIYPLSVSVPEEDNLVEHAAKPAWYRDCAEYFLSGFEKFRHHEPFFSEVRSLFFAALDRAHVTLSADTKVDVGGLLEATGASEGAEDRPKRKRTKPVRKFDSPVPHDVSLAPVKKRGRKPAGVYAEAEAVAGGSVKDEGSTPEEESWDEYQEEEEGRGVELAEPECVLSEEGGSSSQADEGEFGGETAYTRKRRRPSVKTPEQEEADKIYPCPDCDKKFSTKRSLEFHQVEHSTDGPRLTCSQCPKTFFHEAKLTKHVRNCHRPGGWACDECGATYKSRLGLSEHKERHKGLSRKCPHCGVVFHTLLVLKNHIRNQHTDRQPILCDICGRTFKHQHSLNYHTQVAHEPSGNFKCEMCPQKTFHTAIHLRDHQKRHGQTWLLQCASCGQQFKTVSGLRKHEVSHTGVRPFACHKCEKTYLSQGDLNKHLRVHAGDRRYKCTLCEKAFFVKCDLDSHMNTHTGNRPHVCNVCGAAFAYSGMLSIHKRSKHPL
ncbi:unnamed protein product [Cyprideis torosa]|uniref:Uncharacterized protein n=1 Tax=Cyprideis torosa TaxID=163714 RepID=A0A7R8WGN5_9CRUS|nr:unnamed protein product [Cyprideis torosa]CAG0898340.1 unnamed protein product [Cyprideis torosa]